MGHCDKKDFFRDTYVRYLGKWPNELVVQYGNYLSDNETYFVGGVERFQCLGDVAIEIDNDERGVIGDFATISDIRITKVKPEPE